MPCFFFISSFFFIFFFFFSIHPSQQQGFQHVIIFYTRLVIIILDKWIGHVLYCITMPIIIIVLKRSDERTPTVIHYKIGLLLNNIQCAMLTDICRIRDHFYETEVWSMLVCHWQSIRTAIRKLRDHIWTCNSKKNEMMSKKKKISFRSGFFFFY